MFMLFIVLERKKALIHKHVCVCVCLVPDTFEQRLVFKNVSELDLAARRALATEHAAGNEVGCHRGGDHTVRKPAATDRVSLFQLIDCKEIAFDLKAIGKAGGRTGGREKEVACTSWMARSDSTCPSADVCGLLPANGDAVSSLFMVL